jgi:hypothetical protein
MFGSLSAMNDNIASRRRYVIEPECLPHIPAARYLIKKYISAYWKNDQDDLDYVYQEIDLCRYMLMPTENPIARKLKIKWVARVLGVNPIILHNDPNLPF